MIDTDKYEGHLAHLEYELWAFTDFMNINATHEERCATDALLNDAPLLLEEVKRLRGIAKTCLEAIEAGGDIRSGTIELIEHNLKRMIEDVDISN